MCSLDQTNQEILGSHREMRRREIERSRVLAPIRAIDEMIDELEELHLTGRKRVPESWQERLAILGASLPGSLRMRTFDLRSRITIVHLMDRLYEVQHVLLRVKTNGQPTAGDVDLSQAS